MIDRALVFLRDQLNAALAAKLGGGAGGAEDPVTFPDGDKLDPLTLKTGQINTLLVALEQDHVMRRNDPFVRVLPDGGTARAEPEVRLNLMVLFVARHHVYEAGLAALSQLLAYFQANPVFTAATAPALDPRIERLTVELHTMAMSEQNDLWGALRLAYHPSLLFKIRMLVFQDGSAMAGPPVSEPRRELAHAVPSAG
jgi:hypothetical protein